MEQLLDREGHWNLLSGFEWVDAPAWRGAQSNCFLSIGRTPPLISVSDAGAETWVLREE
jgi:hypothetical protein